MMPRTYPRPLSPRRALPLSSLLPLLLLLLLLGCGAPSSQAPSPSPARPQAQAPGSEPTIEEEAPLPPAAYARDLFLTRSRLCVQEGNMLFCSGQAIGRSFPDVGHYGCGLSRSGRHPLRCDRWQPPPEEPEPSMTEEELRSIRRRLELGELDFEELSEEQDRDIMLWERREARADPYREFIREPGGDPIERISAGAAGGELIAVLHGGRLETIGTERRPPGFRSSVRSSIGSFADRGDPDRRILDELGGLLPEHGIREIVPTATGGCGLHVIGDPGEVTSGEVFCWGGSLTGRELTPESAIPQRTLLNAHGVAANSRGGCAITDRGVFCWGEPFAGPEAPAEVEAEEGGAPEPTDQEREARRRRIDRGLEGGPDRIFPLPLPEPVQLGLGEGFGCARVADGRVFCWGRGARGELGLGEVVEAEVTELPELRAVDLIVGDHSACARRRDGRSVCWGDNRSGQLGLGHTRRVDRPTHVPALNRALSLALGPELHCARFEEGPPRCAGRLVELVRGPRWPTLPPRPLPGSRADAVFVGQTQLCVRREGALRCHGRGREREIDEQRAASGWPQEVERPEALAGRVEVSGGICLRWRDGRLRCDFGGKRVALEGTRALASFGSHACVIDAEGQVRCWNSTEPEGAPEVPSELRGARQLDLSREGGCAVLEGGRVRCWRRRGRTPLRRADPFPEVTDAEAVAVVSGDVCVLRRGGRIDCLDHDGGHGVLSWIEGGATHLISGGDGWCAIREGRVYCITRILHPDLRVSPQEGLRDVVALGASEDGVCALDLRGQVSCWGHNTHSQLGVIRERVRLDWTPVTREVVLRGLPRETPSPAALAPFSL